MLPPSGVPPPCSPQPRKASAAGLRNGSIHHFLSQIRAVPALNLLQEVTLRSWSLILSLQWKRRYDCWQWKNGETAVKTA
ncbi:hypothetical protein EJB05_16569, partial [Eragrostis curvula]